MPCGKALKAGSIDVDTFQQRMTRSLVAYHVAAYLLNGQPLDDAARTVIAEQVTEQVDYLNGFADVLAGAAVWSAVFDARARLYAGSVTPTYWRGQTRGYDLPGYPAVGTDCLVNCRCAWELDKQADGSVNAYWRRHANDSCAVCLARETEWAPYVVPAP
jgi:hypothetical protein